MKDLGTRARRHAALGDPARLAIVDELWRSDRAPTELGQRFDLPTNLLAHHLHVLEDVGLISRHRSSGDGRRRYVHLERAALDGIGPGANLRAQPALFVCTANSARSQLAAALWEQLTDQPAMSAGTHPAPSVHRGAVAAARRAGLDIDDHEPRSLDDLAQLPTLAITVCDQAHEELGDPETWLHWSVPDPVPTGSRTAFDRAVGELRDRITAVIDAEAVAS